VGLCTATPPEEARHFTAWLDAGHHAGMGWLERGRDRRLDPQRVLPGARSFVVVALAYARPGLAAGGAAATEASRREDGDDPHGFVARYARGDDYHRVMGDRLARIENHIEVEAPGHRALAYVDTGPLLERMWAARAGIGWIGKNALVLNEEMGSFFLLGLVITTVALPPDVPVTDRCGGCTRCLDSCPTRAIVAPRVVDSRRCIAYQTIEHRGSIALDDRPGIGERLFGCDDCQEACPYNGPDAETAAGPLGRRPETSDASLASLLEMTEADYVDRFRGSAMKRATFTGLRRNAALALGHAAARIPAGSAPRARAEAALARAAADEGEEPVVREQALWSLRQATREIPPSPDGDESPLPDG